MNADRATREDNGALRRILHEILSGSTSCTEHHCRDPLCATHRRDRLAALLDRVPCPPPDAPPAVALAGRIDHTVLRPDAAEADIERAAYESVQYRFAALCINPCHVDRAVALVKGSAVAVCTVAGFPLGASSTSSKVFEARDALNRGAREIDMVLNVGSLRSRRFEALADDIRAVTDAVHGGGGICKVILETALLTEREKVTACMLAEDAGADFVKTSTGFASAGATVHDVALLHSVVGGRLGIKAAGGIRTAEAARAMISAGATRIGASASVAIVTEGSR